MILIDQRSRKPIYEQIVDNVKSLIITGVLKRDDQLPSVRSLAQKLAINPNTIQKAYAELEREGVTYSLKGRGSFVGSSLTDLRNSETEDMLEQVFRICKNLQQMMCPKELVLEKVEEAYRMEKGVEQSD